MRDGDSVKQRLKSGNPNKNGVDVMREYSGEYGLMGKNATKKNIRRTERHMEHLLRNRRSRQGEDERQSLLRR